MFMHIIPSYRVSFRAKAVEGDDPSREHLVEFRVGSDQLEAFISVLRFNNVTSFSAQLESTS